MAKASWQVFCSETSRMYVERLRNGNWIVRTETMALGSGKWDRIVEFVGSSEAAKMLLTAGVDLESAGLGEYVVADLD